MKLSIDHLTDTTDWVLDAPSTIIENEHTGFIAGLNEKSLMIKFDSTDTTRTATKTFTSIDVSDYESLVFSIWSQKYGKYEYNKSSDFNYKIQINDTNEFYIRIWETFSDVTIGIEDIDSIDRIVITALHNTEDFIIISEMVAEKEEIPPDILFCAKEAIEYYLTDEFGDGKLIATGIQASIDDDTITFPSGADFIEKYAVIKIVEDDIVEYHQLGDNNGVNYKLMTLYDGKSIVNDFTDANVYLQYPVFINPDYNNVRLPGIAVWGIDPQPILRGGKTDVVIDTFSVDNDNFKGRVEGQIFEYTVLFDCEAHHSELIDDMTRIIRRFISQEVIWINGRKHDIGFAGKPTEQRPSQGIDIIPKIQYGVTIEVKENINKRSVLPKTTSINTTVDIQ